jgi:cytochrome b
MTEFYTQKIKVWDSIVRLFHWSLVITYSVSFFTQEEDYDLHLIAGYTVLGLVIARIFWGFAGTRYARFSNFVKSPVTVTRHIFSVLQNKSDRYIGHNPAGGMMILALIIVLLVITISGVALDAAENRAGPLGTTTLFYYTDTIAEIHNIATNISLGLVALHLAGIFYGVVVLKEKLISAMITGKKSMPVSRK